MADKVLGRLKKRSRVSLVVLGGVVGAVAIYAFAGGSANDCSSQAVQATVFQIVRENILVAMTKSDNAAMKGLGEVGAFFGAAASLGQYATAANKDNADRAVEYAKTLKQKADGAKLKFTTLAQESAEGSNYVCSGSLSLEVPNPPTQPLVGNIALKFTVQPNLVEGGTSVIKLYW